MTDKNALVSAFAAICGEEHALCGDDIPERYVRDWAKTTSGRPLAVVLPANVGQVSALLKFCDERRIAVIPQGGHTGLCGGATPDASGRQVVLAMRRMRAIRVIDAPGLSITAECGCALEELRQAAAAQGLFFPLDLGARGSCQLGGNLATNAGGLNVLRYGAARDLCLGLEAVLPDGRALNLLSAVRKNNTGYDLRQLLIGSEGTLAVLTAATMKLFPPAPPVLTAWAETPSVDAALRLLNDMQAATGGAISAFELMSQPQFSLSRRHCPEARLPFSPPPARAILLEASGREDLAEAALTTLTAAAARGLIGETAVAGSEAQRREFWRLREMAPVANARHGGWARTDVALPLSALSAFVADMERELPAVCDGLYIIGFGHVGDGNLHVSVRPKDKEPSQNAALTEKLVDVIYDGVARHGGAFSAEHGIGLAKTAALAKRKDAAALDWMRQIKRATDPNNTLNPGRVLQASGDLPRATGGG